MQFRRERRNDPRDKFVATALSTLPVISHTEYAGTFAHWLLDEAAGGTTATSTVGGSTYNLVVTGTSITAPTTPLVIGREFFEDTGAAMKSAATQTPRANFVGAVDMWGACWIYFTETASQCRIFVYGGTQTTETEVHNELCVVRINANNTVRYAWESGAGIDRATTSSTSIVAGDWTHLIWAKVSNGGGTSKQSIYINGILRGQTASQTDPTGGTDAAVRLALGSSAGASIIEPFSGIIDDVILVQATINDSDALAIYNQTAGN
jgi:hypothetical protein